MQCSTQFLEGKKFATQVGTHTIFTDQPVGEGGFDAGPTPPELLLASLSACAAHYAKEYLQSRNLPMQGLLVTVSAEKGGSPVKLQNFRIYVETGPLDEKYRPPLLRAVRSCLVHRSLVAGPDFVVELAPAEHDLAMRGCTALTQS